MTYPRRGQSGGGASEEPSPMRLLLDICLEEGEEARVFWAGIRSRQRKLLPIHLPCLGLLITPSALYSLYRPKLSLPSSSSNPKNPSLLSFFKTNGQQQAHQRGLLRHSSASPSLSGVRHYLLLCQCCISDLLFDHLLFSVDTPPWNSPQTSGSWTQAPRSTSATSSAS